MGYKFMLQLCTKVSSLFIDEKTSCNAARVELTASSQVGLYLEYADKILERRLTQLKLNY